MTFDFPDVVQAEYADALAALVAQTGWQVEVAPEANQGALQLLVSEVLPQGAAIVKGPAIHRIERRVAVTLALPGGHAAAPGAAQWEAAQARYLATSGYKLEITLVEQAPGAVPGLVPGSAAAGEPLEINAAYAVLKQALAGSTLYRTSLKDGAIVLSFISPQVGERYRATIDRLAQEIGWPLRINPQPNQGAIVDAARLRLLRQDCIVVKGPSIFVDRGEVSATLASLPDAGQVASWQQEFLVETGYRLCLAAAGPAAAAPTPAALAAAAGVVEIAVAQVRISAPQQAQALNPAKLDNAIQRARRDGRITPPIAVRRLRDGYLLLDGLYRLRAAQALGLERVAAVVEG